MHTTVVGQVCFDNMLRLIDRAGRKPNTCPACGSSVRATLLPWDFPFTEAVRRAQDDCRAAYQRKHPLLGPTPAWRCLDFGGPWRPPWPRWRATAPSYLQGSFDAPGSRATPPTVEVAGDLVTPSTMSAPRPPTPGATGLWGCWTSQCRSATPPAKPHPRPCPWPEQHPRCIPCWSAGCAGQETPCETDC
jgi:hypothetical protein